MFTGLLFIYLLSWTLYVEVNWWLMKLFIAYDLFLQFVIASEDNKDVLKREFFSKLKLGNYFCDYLQYLLLFTIKVVLTRLAYW